MSFDVYHTPATQSPNPADLTPQPPVYGIESEGEAGIVTRHGAWAEPLERTRPDAAERVGELVVPESFDITAPPERGRRAATEPQDTADQTAWRDPVWGEPPGSSKPREEQSTRQPEAEHPEQPEVTPPEESRRAEETDATALSPQADDEVDDGIVEEWPPVPGQAGPIWVTRQTDREIRNDAPAPPESPPRETEITVREPEPPAELREPFEAPPGRVVVDYRLRHTAVELGGQILSEIGSSDKDIPMARIDDHFAQQGLRTAPALIIKPEQIPELRARAATGADPQDVQMIDSLGGTVGAAFAAYLSSLDLVVFVDWPALQGNPAFKEAVLVHEKAHSAHDHNVWMLPRTDYESPVLPQLAEEDLGALASFILEGGAEYQAAQYTRQHYGPQGMWDEDYKTIHFPGEKPVVMPASYAWLLNGAPRAAYGAYAALSFELIAEQFPDFPAALVRQNKTPEGIIEVATILEQIKPFLYEDLIFQKTTFPSAIRTLRRIQELLKEYQFNNSPLQRSLRALRQH